MSSLNSSTSNAPATFNFANPFADPTAADHRSDMNRDMNRMSISSQEDSNSFRSRMGSVFSRRKSSAISLNKMPKDIPEGGSLVPARRESYVPRYAAKGYLGSTGGAGPYVAQSTTPGSEKSDYIPEPDSPSSA